MADIEIVLEQKGERWIGRGDGFVVEGADMAELDGQLKREITQSRRFPEGAEVTVFMACDRRIIPSWMRPYHSHYFNRAVSFVIKEGG
jgi:hypothetical protein